MAYFLQEHPNTTTAQYGWPRTKVSGVVGVHTAESGVVFSGPDGGAENVAWFIQRRSDHGSYHSIADADSIVTLVHPKYAAWADTTNNAHALSVSGAMNAARWRDLPVERADAIVRNMAHAAALLVQTAVREGLLASPTPARRITAAEAKAGTRAGFYGHGETNPGTRYDPGTNFNWGLFLSTYDNAINGTTEEDEEMADISAVQAEAIAARAAHLTLHSDVDWYGFTGVRPNEGRKTTTLALQAGWHDTQVAALHNQIAELKAIVKQLSVATGVTIDYDAIAKAVNDDAAQRLAK